MADASYGNQKVYMKQGADEQVIASGGKQTVESGGEVKFEAGSALKINDVQVNASAAELNLLDLSAQTETVAAAGAVSVTKRITKLAVASGGAVTLAAPDATMLGQVKIIEMTTDDGNVTLALTNVQGQSSGTTATFADLNDALVLIGGTSKWHVIGESGIALS